MLLAINTKTHFAERKRTDRLQTFGLDERGLQDILFKSLDRLFPDDDLVLLMQSRRWQEEPDLMAVDKDGNLYIFELKAWESQSANLSSSVPILDDFTQCALSVISKLEADITSLPETDSDYRKFVHLWKTLYDRYAAALNEIDIGTYPYRVRIFDKILSLLGDPRYGLRTAIPQ